MIDPTGHYECEPGQWEVVSAGLPEAGIPATKRCVPKKPEPVSWNVDAKVANYAVAAGKNRSGTNGGIDGIATELAPSGMLGKIAKWIVNALSDTDDYQKITTDIMTRLEGACKGNSQCASVRIDAMTLAGDTSKVNGVTITVLDASGQAAGPTFAVDGTFDKSLMSDVVNFAGTLQKQDEKKNEQEGT